MAFFEDSHLFAGLSGTDDFFELWEAKHFPVVSIFDDEDVRDSIQRTDFKLMRTGAFENQTLWDTLTKRTIPHFDREGAERYVCELLGGHGRCGLVFSSWKKVDGAPNTQQGWTPRHQITTTSLSYHESKCQLWQHIRRRPHSAESRRQRMDQRHLQNRSQSHDRVTRHTANQLQ